MKIVIGSDHGGYRLKRHLIQFLKNDGIDAEDLGCPDEESVDYPDYAAAVAGAISKRTVDRGILVCTTGIGVSISANKFSGVRASLCLNQDMAELTRRHNDSNILCLSQRYTTAEMAEIITRTWLNTEFEKGRHAKRVAKIESYGEQCNG